MLNSCFNDLWLSLPTPIHTNSPPGKHVPSEIDKTLKCVCLFGCRSTSRATPYRVPTWRRPRRGLPGRPSTSRTTAGTTSSASATPAKLASRTPASWRWGGRGSRCATAPATDPRAAPPTVSAEWKRQMVLTLQLAQPLDLSVISLQLALCVSAG